jgi:hypothetical protein
LRGFLTSICSSRSAENLLVWLLKLGYLGADNDTLHKLLESIMNVSSLGSQSTNLSTAKTEQAIGIAVLKKALDSETSTASALLDALPAVPSTSNLPPNLGRNINTTA